MMELEDEGEARLSTACAACTAIVQRGYVVHKVTIGAKMKNLKDTRGSIYYAC